MLTVGLQVISVRNLKWIYGDVADFYIAWRQYLHDPAATGLRSNYLGFPFPVDFAIFDPMPIFLWLAKLSYPNVMDGYQFFGLYFIASLALQGLFGSLIVLEVLKALERRGEFKRPGVIVLIALSVFFVSTPFTLIRLATHTALASHWVLLLALWIAIKSRNHSTARWLAFNLPLAFLACGVSPYLAFMAVLATTLTAFFAVRQVGVSSILLRVAVLTVFSVASLYCFGFGAAAAIEGEGYGFYSMNLLAAIDSNGYGWLLPINISDATGGQSFEGFNYLGAGTLLLLSIALFVWLRGRRGASLALPIAGLLAVVAVSFLLAVSTTPTLGEHVFRWDAPGWLNSPLSRLRASGRLFWIGGFAAITIAVIVLLSRLRTRSLAWVSVILALVQLIDIAGVANGLREANQLQPRYRFSPEANGVATDGYRAVMVQPPWQCTPHGSPGGVHGFEYFGMYAVAHNLPTNSFYAGRNPKDVQPNYCARLPLVDAPSPLDLHVLAAPVYIANRTMFEHFSCTLLRETQADVVCVDPAKRLADSEAARDARSLFQAHVNVPVAFTLPGSASAFPEAGWSVREPWGIWSLGTRAIMRIEKSAEHARVIRMTVTAFLPRSGYVQRVGVSINDVPVEQFELREGRVQIDVTIPAALQSAETLLVKFELPDATSPAQAGMSGDPRLLALGMVSYELRP